MANTVIKLKKSAVPSEVPGDLQYGELAINYADGKLFYKDNVGSIQEISGAAGGDSFSTINVNNSLIIASGPGSVLGITNGNNIDLSADIINDILTISANLKPAYDVANAAFDKANVGGGSATINVGSSAPATPNVGSLWWNTNSGRLFIYYTDTDSSQWVETSPSGGTVDYAAVTANILPTFNSAFNTANAAFGKANSALANTSGVVFNGNLNISTDLWIGNNITNVSSIILNTSTNRTPDVPGELTWSQDDSTIHFEMDNNVVAHIGQDLYYYVKNQTGAAINVGTVVRFAGTVGASGRLLVVPAIANNSYPSKYVVGVTAETIPDGTDGFVLSQGKIRGIDTSMFSEGDILYVSSSTPGAFANTLPTAPNNKITIAAVVKKDNTQGTIEVRVTLGSKLNEDELIELNGLANGDILTYVSGNGRFENSQALVAAFGVANAAFTSANNVAPQVAPAFNTANAAYTIANAAFGSANTALKTNSFSTINVSGSNVVSSLANDVLNITTDGSLNISTNPITKTINFAIASQIDYGLVTGAVTATNDYGSLF